METPIWEPHERAARCYIRSISELLEELVGEQVVFLEALRRRIDGAVFKGALIGIQGTWQLSLVLKTGRKGQGCP